MPAVAGRGLGWRPDPPKRPGQTADLLARPRLRTIAPPIAASTRQYLGPTLNQGRLGTCVENAGCRAYRASQVRQGEVSPPLGSRLFVNYLCSAIDHTVGQDAGTFVRNFFQVVTKFGMPPEHLWPYSDDPSPGAPFARMPPPDVFRAAFDQSSNVALPRYYRINTEGEERVLDVKRAIAAGFPVVFGTDVSVAFCNGDLGDRPLEPPLDLEIAGGHCQIIGEYDPDSAGIAGSYGDDFGDGGWYRYSWNYIKWQRTQDLWIVDTAPTFSEV